MAVVTTEFGVRDFPAPPERQVLALKSRRIGRPAIDPELRKLIREIPAQSLACGAPHIDGELLKIGAEVSQATVSKYVRRHRKPPSQSWRPTGSQVYGNVIAVPVLCGLHHRYTRMAA